MIYCATAILSYLTALAVQLSILLMHGSIFGGIEIDKRLHNKKFHNLFGE
jgi:hypothetical protein